MPKHIFTDCQMIQITEAFSSSKNTCEYKRLQCLRLRFETNMTLKEIAEVVGFNHKSVGNIIDKFFKEGLDSIVGEHRTGGNKRYLSVTEEDEILKPFLEDAEKGRMLIVSNIHKAYEKVINRKVPASTIYRLLERHGWRKIMPRSKHPKSKPEEFSAYKKNH